VTDKVSLEFVEQVSAEERRNLPLLIVGLFGNDAPRAVELFKAACAGTLNVPCPTEVDLSAEVTERAKQTKKTTLRACQGYADMPLTYAYSQVWSIQRGKRIGAGAVQGKFALRVAPSMPVTESSTLSHDSAGLLSMRRGGGSFDFILTTGPAPEYDSDFAVIGRVLDGMDALAELDAIPVVKAADAFNVADASQSREKACAYDSPQPFCAQSKPLRKVTLLRTAVL